MFSVDNFYDFVDSHYGVRKSKNVLWAFATHGSKDLNDLIPTRVDDATFVSQRGNFSTLGSVVLHDQEPFFYGSLDTYKESKRSDKKLWEIVQHLMPEELFFPRLTTCSWPIWCHSEQNSQDIQRLVDLGFAECHYFWHGMISRDWFRHWKHHADINAPHPWTKRFLLYCRAFDGSREYRKSVVNFLSNYKSYIQYDWENTTSVTPDYSAKLVPEDACSAAVQIVLETIFDDEKIYVTEKVFKPIAMRQPFVIFAAPYTLAYLKQYGFMTYDSVWDESYDHELNHDVRKCKILKLINDLSLMSDVEFASTVQKCQEIVDYNHRHFFSQDFENILLNELHSNFSSCIDQQQEKSRQDPGGSFWYFSNSIYDRRLRFTPGHLQKMTMILAALEQTQPVRYEQIIRQHPWVTTLSVG